MVFQAEVEGLFLKRTEWGGGGVEMLGEDAGWITNSKRSADRGDHRRREEGELITSQGGKALE